MAKSDEIFVAKRSGVFEYEGKRVVIREGVTRVRAGHPILKGRESLFEPLQVHYDVEQATRAPGEKRGRRGPVKAEATEADGEE